MKNVEDEHTCDTWLLAPWMSPETGIHRIERWTFKNMINENVDDEHTCDTSFYTLDEARDWHPWSDRVM